MMEFLKSMFYKKNKFTEIPTTESLVEDSMTLFGEDPGAIPPDDALNPLTDEAKE